MAEVGVQGGGSLFVPESLAWQPETETVSWDWFEDFLALVRESGARVLFWSCPLNHPDQRPLRPTIDWEGDVAHCLQCPMTSELHRSILAWCYEEASDG